MRLDSAKTYLRADSRRATPMAIRIQDYACQSTHATYEPHIADFARRSDFCTPPQSHCHSFALARLLKYLVHLE